MKKNSKSLATKQSNSFSFGKKTVYNIILVAISLVILGLIELGLRTFSYGKDLALFKESTKYPGYFEINDDITFRYFSKVGHTSPTSDIFLINKPDTCYRIFVFGGSTTRGFPYQEGTAFPRILYYRLQDAFPNKRIEIINLSASAINSYSYIDMAKEVLKHEPDAILVYGGHNEYYGALGVGSVEKGGNARWMKKLHLRLGRLRVYQLVQAAIKNSISAFQQPISDQATLMERIVKNKEIPYNTEVYLEGVDQFQTNLSELIRKCKANEIPIFISDLVSNTKDLPPFNSAKTEETETAVDVYLQAKKEEASGNYNKAKDLFNKAKDLDAIRFRAPEDFNNCIYKLGEKHNIPVVQMKSSFENKSPNGLIGDNLMIDHLHPNIDGYFLMAEAFFNTLKETKAISSNWDTTFLYPSEYYRETWGFTELDSLIGDLNIRSLKSGWPFKQSNELNIFLKTYRPNGIVDSMAFNYLTSTVRHIEDEHIKLANLYAQYGMYKEAYEEYNSLIRMHPYIGDIYYDAAKYLIKQKRYIDASNIIKQAPLLQKDYYYFYMLGTLELKTGSVKHAIKLLNHSYDIIPQTEKPTKILFPLYAAYKSINDNENKTRILELIRKYEPNFRPMPTAENPVVKYKMSVDELYDIALKTAKQGNYNKAIELLQMGNKHEEKFEIKKLLATLYSKSGNDSLALLFSIEAFDINPYNIENLNNLFLLYLNANDLDNSKDILTRIENLVEDNLKISKYRNLYDKKAEELNITKP